MTIYDLIAKWSGARTNVSDDPMGVVNATTTPQKFLNNNPNRISMIVVNGGANDILIWTDASVSSTKGIRLAGNGGEVEFYYEKHLDLPAKEWWVVATTGTSAFNSKSGEII